MSVGNVGLARRARISSTRCPALVVVNRGVSDVIGDCVAAAETGGFSKSARLRWTTRGYGLAHRRLEGVNLALPSEKHGNGTRATGSARATRKIKMGAVVLKY